MKKTKILVHKDFQKNQIDPRIYGSFVEHMGRVVYTGIYEPSHPTADADGFRQDVLEKTKEMGVTAVRYPGGNFVSNYNWLDGVGPKEQRPRKLDLAWKKVETNQVGTDEFMKWANKADVLPIFAVNLGTKGIEEALSLLEYCNMPAGSYYSDLRCSYGRKEPYRIKTWCLGNEMDGDWQIGHKTAEEYGRLAYETGKAMKIMDPEIELVLCGSSLSTNATFGDWDQTVLRNAYGCADYISLHQYYGCKGKKTEDFLALSLDMERFIQAVCGMCDAEMVRRRTKKQLNICFDEWGVWGLEDEAVNKDIEAHPWREAPRFGEQFYTMEDTLLFSSMLMNLIRYSSRVKIACQSLLTNVSACIMTEPDGELWLQPIFYPFAFMAEHGKGIVLEERAQEDTYETAEFEKVPYVDHVTVYNPEKKEVALFLVNRGEETAQAVLELEKFQLAEGARSWALYHKDRKAMNRENHKNIVPQEMKNFRIRDNVLECEMEPLSFQMICIPLAE